MNTSRGRGPGSYRFSALSAALAPAAVAALVALVAGLLAGCGSAVPVTTTPASPKHAEAPSPAVPRISSRLRAQEAAIHRQVLASLHHEDHARYGGVPADLRGKQAAPVDQLLSATATHPVIAIQGNGVKLHLAHGSALATAVGPDVPDRIQGSGDLHTPATWDLTFADVHGTIPIAASRFTITDEQGSLLRPRLSAAAAPLPKTVPAGRPFTLKLRTTISIGDGKLRFAPSGGRWLAEWDFDVETD